MEELENLAGFAGFSVVGRDGQQGLEATIGVKGFSLSGEVKEFLVVPFGLLGFAMENIPPAFSQKLNK